MNGVVVVLVVGELAGLELGRQQTMKRTARRIGPRLRRFQFTCTTWGSVGGDDVCQHGYL